MRIDGNYHPNLNLGKDKAGSSKNRSLPGLGIDAPESTEAKGANPSLIEAAFATEDINQAAVQAAREALANGELDTPEAARRVAAAILDTGI